MSTDDKLAYRILQSKPVPNNITPKELRSLAQQLGWRVEEGAGSHTKFYLPTPSGKTKMYPIPLGNVKEVKACYIKDIRKIMSGED